MTKTTIDRIRERQELDAESIAELDRIELDVTHTFTLSDAMRAGAEVVDQEPHGWGHGDTACALHQAFIAAAARGVFDTKPIV